MCAAPFFENREIDPRDCKYRANGKIRKSIEQAIRSCKIRYGLMRTDEEEDLLHASTSPLKHRSKSKKSLDDDVDDNNKENCDTIDGDDDGDVLMHGYNRTQMKTFVRQIDAIMAHEDEQKQTFTYDNLVQLHRLLQYVENDDTPERKSSSKSDCFRNQFFFQFMENNFRVISPEKRRNATLEQRLRKLKYQAASSDYQAMTANLPRGIRSALRSGSDKSSQFTIGRELQNIRPTLIATLNAFMVIAATFAFFYFAFAYTRPDYSVANRVLISFIASMVVAVAEIYFLIRII